MYKILATIFCGTFALLSMHSAQAQGFGDNRSHIAMERQVSTLRNTLESVVKTLRQEIVTMKEELAGMEDRLQRFENCANKKRAYAPNEASADAEGCVIVGELEVHSAATNKITGLTPGKKYLVDVYGTAQSSAGVRITDCEGNVLIKRGSYGHTGRHSVESMLLPITAPESGCIIGYTRGGGTSAGSMTAFSL